jgi:hypothetical protein
MSNARLCRYFIEFQSHLSIHFLDFQIAAGYTIVYEYPSTFPPER